MTTTTPILPATLRLGAVHLTVTDLARSIDFYETDLGLQTRLRDGDAAYLGAGGEDVLVLHEDRSARPAGRHAGLYHYALLLGSREELARSATRLAAHRTPIQGMSDHGTHEAIYLPDPDGIGIELAADRPREEWSPTWTEEAGPQPLDVPSLLGTIEGEAPTEKVDSTLAMGHVHLHVGDVEDGLAFYRDVLGFEYQMGFSTAAFVSAGGYHHHVAFNTWKGRGAPPQPAGVVGLRHWTAVLPGEADVAEVRARAEAAGAPVEPVDGGVLIRDPWGLAVAFVA